MTRLSSLAYADLPPSVADALLAILPVRLPQGRPGDTGTPLKPVRWSPAGDCALVCRVNRRRPYTYRNVSVTGYGTVRRYYPSTRYRIGQRDWFVAVCRQGRPVELRGPFPDRDAADACAAGLMAADH